MAQCHELTETNGVTEFAYLGERPWHGLGQVIRHGATVEEMAVSAGMAWDIRRATVQYGFVEMKDGFPMPEVRDVADRVVLYRSDTKAPLGVVSARYNEVQPRQALEFFRDIVETGGYVFESAGTMRGGARLFATVRPEASFELPGGDVVQGRILLATACDGSMATSVRPVTIRVVCKNTLQAAMAGSPMAVTVRHSSVFRPEPVKEQLRKICSTFDAFRHTAETLAATQMTVKRAEDFLIDVLPGSERVPVEQTRGFKRIMELFDGGAKGAEMASSRGTAWGLLNAVTEYVDHAIPARSDERRLESALFGDGAALKNKVFQLLTA